MAAGYRLIWPFDALSMIAAANAALIVAAAVLFLFNLIFCRSRRLRDWGICQRNLLRNIGVGVLSGVLLFAWVQAGWYRHGIALFVAGLSGLVWMLFVAALTAERTIRIQTMLWGILCFSLVFGGWSMGISRSRGRARMIKEIRSEGGDVSEVSWWNQREELNLPPWSRGIFGQSNIMVDHVAIPARVFSRDAVRSWCFDDVTSIRVFSDKKLASVVDSEAIAAIPTGTPLDYFEVSKCSVDERGMESLSRIGSIETLRLDLQGDALPRQMGQFRTLTSLHLTNAMVDDQFLKSIRTLPSLYDLTLADPVFEMNLSVPPEIAISYLTVTGGTLDISSLTILGSYGRSLRLIGCRLLLQSDDSLQMPGTKSLWIEQCGLSDAKLLRFADLPKLEWITSRGDAVTQVGRDAFKAKRPDITFQSY